MSEENPFGEGGFDMNALMQQAQQMQEQLLSAQTELAQERVEGTVGGGLVTVTVSGTGDMVGVQIRAGSFDPDDTDDLADMIVAAYRDAKTRADNLAQERLGPMAEGLGGGSGPGDALGGPGAGPAGFGGPPGGPGGNPGV